MPAHSIGSGTISFGLVSVPVKLYSATKSQSISFNLLHAKDKSRLRQQYTCATCGEIVDRSAMVKGYEFSKDQYVVLTDEELKALEQASDQSIEIEEFVPISEIDPIYFDKTYLLGADKGGQKAYRLLCDAMQRGSRAALARFSTRGKQQLVLLREAQGGLMLHSLFYHDEVRSFDEIDRGQDAKIKDGELDLAVQLIDQLATPHFSPEKYHDDYRQRIVELIEQKAAGQEIVAAPAAAPKAQIIDLMDALKASLAAKEKKAPVGQSAAATRKPARVKAAAPRRRSAAAGK
jgi:DNA end-binding protein Ku